MRTSSTTKAGRNGHAHVALSRAIGITFWILWSINAVIGLVFVVFFFIGIADGTVSSINMALWLAILFALGGILWGSYALRAAGRTRPANGMLMVLAIPGVLIGVLLLAVLILQPKWN